MSLPVNKTTFVFLKRTRQVLATTTRLALPPNAIPTGSETTEQLTANTAAELERLVGAELRVRDLPVESTTGASPPAFDLIGSGITFPATELDVVTGDFKPTSFADPRQYFIEENLAKSGENPTDLVVTVTGTNVEVEIKITIKEDRNVLVWVFRDDKTKDPILLDGIIKNGVTPLKVNLPVALTTGVAYHWLVLVQNFRPALIAKTI